MVYPQKKLKFNFNKQIISINQNRQIQFNNLESLQLFSFYGRFLLLSGGLNIFDTFKTLNTKHLFSHHSYYAAECPISSFSVQCTTCPSSTTPIALETQPSVSRHTGLKNMVRPARDHAATKHTVQANVEIDSTYFIGIPIHTIRIQ